MNRRRTSGAATAATEVRDETPVGNQLPGRRPRMIERECKRSLRKISREK